MTPVMEVLAPGPTATIQDLGRPGYARWGVGPSGAADRRSHLLANRLVGNHDDAATIEVTLGGLVLRFVRPGLVALTGARCPVMIEGGPPLGHQAPGPVPAGATLRLGSPEHGLRTYLAVRGGIDVARVLGSRSTDCHGHLGPPPLRPGDLLPVGPDPGRPVLVDVAPSPPPGLSPEVTLGVWAGPRSDAAVDRALLDTVFVTSQEINRVGVRLDGGLPPGLARPLQASEALLPGAVQLPPDSRPIIFLMDHPVTGGYPVVAMVDSTDLSHVAQLRPGVAVRFTPRVHG
jgi:biotin-dependent carboxylase-like uncharacterized protein